MAEKFSEASPTVVSESSRSIIKAKWFWVRPLLRRVIEKIMFTDDGVGLLQRIPAVNTFNVDESGLTVCQKTDKFIFCEISYNSSSVSFCELVAVAAVQKMGLR